MIYILYSADYEIFHGENYLPENEVLIKTTERLLNTCDRLGIPITLFCDVTCLWRYRELGLDQFPKQVEGQLKSAISRGHDVQTHIHPHWRKATKKGNRWIWDYGDYLLGNISGNNECYTFSKELFQQSADFFTKLLKPIDHFYQCIAFRAGGWGLQPKEHQILAALQDSNYTIDSTIIPKFVLYNKINKIDFTNVPNKPNYYLSRKTGLKEAVGNGIFEIPIPGEWQYYYYVKQKFLHVIRYLFNKILNFSLNFQDARELRGTTVQTEDNKFVTFSSWSKSIVKKIKRLINILDPGYFPLELSLRSADELFCLTKRYLNRFNTNENIFFSFSSHPKFLFEEDFQKLTRYHNLLLKQYRNKICAITFQEANQIIK